MTLMECVKSYRGDLEDGIADVIFYREGRGWNVTAVWNRGRIGGCWTYDHDDMETMRKIVVNSGAEAYIYNGYYSNLGCDGNGAKCSVKKMYDNIKWLMSLKDGSLIYFYNTCKEVK